ncbi:MAG: hypothetical protein WCR56_04350 [Bacilli bacterium]
MKTVLSSLVNEKNLYNILVETKTSISPMDGKEYQPYWYQINSSGILQGKDIDSKYQKLRRIFIKQYLRDFRFNHYPLRLAIYSNDGFGPLTKPIICEYPDKILVRFALTIPDYYKEAGQIFKLADDLTYLIKRNSPLMIDGHYLRDGSQKKCLDECLANLNDQIKSIQDMGNNAQEVANQRLDCYVEDFLKLYDKGGILRTSDQEEN